MLMSKHGGEQDEFMGNPGGGAAGGALPTPTDLLAIVKRQWPLIASVVVATLAVAVIYLMTAAPKYTAAASILIDSRKNQLFQSQQIVGDVTVDTGMVESQAEILRSETVALSVIRALKLADDQEFTDPGLFGLISGIIGENKPSSDFQRERAAIGYFNKNLVIKRTGTSYAIEIDFTSLNPDRAAEIANHIADAYMVGELEAKYQATKRASEWLQGRMGELREQAAAADRAVQKFKAENNIIDTGRGLISDQQMTEVNTQLTTARAATAEALARLERIDIISNQNVPDATVTDALRSDVISRLRAQYLDFSSREADLSKRFGANHGAAVQIRAQMGGIRNAITDELGRIAQTYRSDYEIARARETALDKRMDELRGNSTLTSQAQVKLRDLESTSQSYRNLYDNFLQRFVEATQQQTSPVNEARVITAATPPTKPSWPKALIVLAAGGALGTFLGAAAAITREMMDDTFRNPAHVEKVTGLKCLGVLPRVAVEPASNMAPADPALRVMAGALGVYRYVIEAPFSRFTEAIRWIKVSSDISALTHKTQVIGIVSALPNEGKTTVAANVAQLVAHSGKKAILIDADLRHPSLSQSIVPDARLGLREVLSGAAVESDVYWRDPITGLHVIPTVMEERFSHNADIISSQAMVDLLSNLRGRYDYIFIDLPPIVSVVDVKAVSHLIDGFVLVIEWGRTTVAAAEEAISDVDLVISRGIGVVLNKADPGQLQRVEQYKGRHFNNYYR